MAVRQPLKPKQKGKYEGIKDSYPPLSVAESLRSGLTLFPSHYQHLDQALGELFHQIPAQFVLLTDVAGQVVAAQGEQSHFDLVALGSLMAGDLAASQEIGRITGEYQNYQLILREGHQVHTFISEAGHDLALLVQVSHEVPLGWARMLILEASGQLARITAAPPEGAETNTLELQQADISELVNTALDDMWLE